MTDYNDIHVDIIIVVGDTLFPSNRSLLEATSGYFKRLLRNPFIETSSGIIVVTGPYGDEFIPKTMQQVLGFIYTNDIILGDENVYAVLLAAEYLDIACLKLICINYLLKSITTQTWIDSFRIASRIHIPVLTSACMDRLCDIYKEIDFSEVNFSELQTIMELQQNRFKISEVFAIIVAWIKCIENERKKHLDQLLLYIDFKKATKKFVNEQVFSETMIAERPDVKSEINETLNDRKLLVVGGWQSAAKSTMKYNPNSKEMTLCSGSPRPCNGSSVAVRGQKVYLVGGDGNEDNIQIYDIKSNTWKLQKHVLHTPRVYSDCAIINETLYVVSGHNVDGQPLSSVEEFEYSEGGFLRPVSGNPTLILTEARRHPAVLARNNELLVIGGCNQKRLKSCEVINVSTRQQYSMTAMNVSRSLLAAVILDDCIIAIGGHDGDHVLASVECYSFRSKKWSFLTPMKTARQGHSACVLDGKIYVVGGWGTNSIEMYNPDTSTWALQEKLDIPRVSSAVVQI